MLEGRDHRQGTGMNLVVTYTHTQACTHARTHAHTHTRTHTHTLRDFNFR